MFAFHTFYLMVINNVYFEMAYLNSQPFQVLKQYSYIKHLVKNKLFLKNIYLCTKIYVFAHFFRLARVCAKAP